MLDILDFQPDKGGDLTKLRESQRRRHGPESTIDDIVALFEDFKQSIRRVDLDGRANDPRKLDMPPLRLARR